VGWWFFNLPIVSAELHSVPISLILYFAEKFCGVSCAEILPSSERKDWG